MKRRSKGLSVYNNLSAQLKKKRDERARQKAEYLATLPKNPFKRFLYRMHPKRVLRYWFSKKGALMALKLAGIGLVIVAIFIAALFSYYRRELDSLKPSEISKRVQSTVTKYYDRNDVLLWEDKGTDNYKLVVDSVDINDNMKNATVAIEDKDFYKHSGISITGIMRATISNVTGGGNVQGASTLTQQLVKNVFFANDAEENRLNVSRKIKEMILAVEVERMYNKDQILTLYLNEVPYGGRRNGVESAAQTYFGKSAKDLTIAEAALVAAIPQNPPYYNPYYIDGNKDLVIRQQMVIDAMQEQGYITQEEADEAKKVAILDTIKPELSGTEDIKAPHFVLTVRSELEKEFGQQFVRSGGLTVKTTLDYRMQQIAEQAVSESYSKYFERGLANNADNMAFTAVDVDTGQIVAMVGSYDFNNKEYGATNAATALLQPGSSIKVFDYSALMKEREGQNFGAGSILADEDISSIYKSKLSNYDGKFFGSISIREALANSRNPPAVKAAYIAGIDNVIQLARDMGDHSYCVDEDYGLSAAIGGCQVREVEHVNAYASLARGGVYKQESYILEVKNSQDQILKQWKDESKQILDPQIPYIISDILSDKNARARVFGYNPLGMVIPGVKTATKTGTTDNGQGKAKDNWMMSYSTEISAGIWVGRHDGGALTGISTAVPGYVISQFMTKVHQDILAPDGKWSADDWFQQPDGVQKLTVNGKTDIYPSWYKKPSNSAGTKMTFDKVSKKKATDCTPEAARIEITVQEVEDPVTKKKSYSNTEGYDPTADDDAHKCDDVKPFVSSITATKIENGKYRISVAVNKGTFDLQSLDVAADGTSVISQGISSAGTFEVDYTFTSAGDKTITARVVDAGYYDATTTKTVNVKLTGSN
ncbi:MAG: transglycosylase domain-containing protein [Candidatus Woesebacteria bacterium]|jgi:penicillin-binding protein 1A